MKKSIKVYIKNYKYKKDKNIIENEKFIWNIKKFNLKK